MYGEYDPYVVYGIMDKSGMILDSEWLYKHFCECSIYTTSIVRNHTCNAVYGMPAYFNTSDGITSIHSKYKKYVEKLYSILLKYYEDRGDFDDLPTLGYYPVIKSYEASNDCLTSYVPLDEDEDEDEEDSNNNNK